jgi:hypothetical protein
MSFENFRRGFESFGGGVLAVQIGKIKPEPLKK